MTIACAHRRLKTATLPFKGNSQGNFSFGFQFKDRHPAIAAMLYPLSAGARCTHSTHVAAGAEELSAGSGLRPSDCAGAARAAAVTAVLLCIPCATFSFLCITTDIYAGSHAFCVRTTLQMQLQLHPLQWPAALPTFAPYWSSKCAPPCCHAAPKPLKRAWRLKPVLSRATPGRFSLPAHECLRLNRLPGGIQPAALANTSSEVSGAPLDSAECPLTTPFCCPEPGAAR